MVTISTPRPRVKPARSLRLLSAPTANRPGLLRIAVGDDVFLYVVERIPADFGQGFKLTKRVMVPVEGGVQPTDAEVYHLNLNGQRSTCECLGHLRHGHRTVCKHIAALLALQSRSAL
jgi:hypothetical protein